MKIVMLVVAMLSLGLATQAKTISTENTAVVLNDPKWEKSKEGTWMGAEKHWYKLNSKDATIWWSMDGKKWEAVKDGMWQDKDGKWLKIVDKDLKWSADGGKTWAQVPEWKWEGHDGVWNKFDKDWSLWTAKK
ncbi:MAG: hypothetical protein SGJ15_00015 [Bacteroidota bacterium]|nr:hypothetical protein [Bacteroidota bacterium]